GQSGVVDRRRLRPIRRRPPLPSAPASPAPPTDRLGRRLFRPGQDPKLHTPQSSQRSAHPVPFRFLVCTGHTNDESLHVPYDGWKTGRHILRRQPLGTNSILTPRGFAPQANWKSFCTAARRNKNLCAVHLTNTDARGSHV